MRRYTPYQKAYVLQKLRENLGDILLTHLQTGVPARTLRDWRQELLYSGLPVGSSAGLPNLTFTAVPPSNFFDSPPPPAPPSTNSDDTSQSDKSSDTHPLERLRDQLMTHIFDLSSSLTDDPETNHLRVAALSRLLDRVLKLHTVVPFTTPEPVEYIYRVEYKDPDGSLHPTPPWQRHSLYPSPDESNQDQSDYSSSPTSTSGYKSGLQPKISLFPDQAEIDERNDISPDGTYPSFAR